MEDKIIKMENSIPVLIKNTHLNISLEGWPAAITAVMFFCSCVAIYAIKTEHSETGSASEGSYAASKAA